MIRFPIMKTLALILSAAGLLAAQTAVKLPPSGKAVDVTAAEIQAFLKQHPYGDDMMRMIDVGSMNAGVSLLRYQKSTAPRTTAIIHSDVPEVYYVISGRGHMKVGNENQSVNAGSVIFVAANVEHRFHDIEEELTVLVFFAPAETP